jgi:hypothetical protein
METMQIDQVKLRVIEASDIDRLGLLRPLLLFRGNITEGRTRAMWNTVVSMMDAEVASVTEAVKLTAAQGDIRHMCGVHSKMVPNGAFNGFLSRLNQTPKVSDLIPGLKDYARLLGQSSGAMIYRLDPIAEFALRVRSHRDWRVMPGHLRPRKIAQEVLPEYYPYVSGTPSPEHEMLMAVDAIVPKGLPNDVRCDVCQDMIVAILSGEASLENLKGDTSKYLKDFWKMFPGKYGHVSLDQPVYGTDKMSWNDKLGSKHSRLTYS